MGWVTDLQSHNGTKLNGEWLRDRHTLRNGDVVTFGECALVLRAPRRPPRPDVDALGLDAFVERLATETARAIRYERPLAIAVMVVSDHHLSKAASSVAQALPQICDVGLDGKTRLVLMFPEEDRDSARAVLMDGLGEVAASARVGIAGVPEDGTTADILLSAARAAADIADAGRPALADQAVRSIASGDQTVLVADPAMTRLYDLAERLAASELSVLVVGESGTGKEHVARRLHDQSARAQKPFVALNCASLVENLAESELFGHERGAFSGAVAMKKGFFEAADAGSLFLDEIGELPLPLQAKLLRVLETKRIMRVGSTRELPVDVRVIAATHRRLEELVAQGRFRQDLLFRLNGATIALPSLRDRPRDVAVLARAFLRSGRERAGQPPMTISAAAMHALIERPWPGNVRELKNVIAYVAVTARAPILEPRHLPEPNTPAGAGLSAPEPAPVPNPAWSPTEGFRPIADELRELEATRMKQALEASGGKQTQAAALIAMPLRTFVTKLKLYGLR